MPLNNAAARPTKTHFHGLEINPQMRIHWNLKERIVMLSHIAKHQLTNLSVDYRIQELHRRLGISNMGQKYIEVIYPRLFTALRARIDILRSSPEHSPMLVGVVEKGGQMRFYPKFMDTWARHGWDGDISKPPHHEVDRQHDDQDEACVILDEVEPEPEPEPEQEGQQQEGDVRDEREADDSVVRIELEADSAASIISPPTPAPVVIPLPGLAPAPAGSLGKPPPSLRRPNGPPQSRVENGFGTGREHFTFQGAAPPLRPFQRPGAAGSAARPDSHHRAGLRRSRVFHSGGSKIPLLVGGVPMLPLPPPLSPPIPGFAHQQHLARDAAAVTAALAGSSPRRRALVLATPCHVTHEMLNQYKASMMRLVELDMERRLCEVEAVKYRVLADAETAEARTRRARQIVADDAYEVRSRLVYLDRELERRGYTSGGQGLGLVAALSLVSLGLALEGPAWSGGR